MSSNFEPKQSLKFAERSDLHRRPILALRHWSSRFGLHIHL